MKKVVGKIHIKENTVNLIDGKIIKDCKEGFDLKCAKDSNYSIITNGYFVAVVSNKDIIDFNDCQN